MSKRREPGDRVWKTANAGFVGEDGWSIIEPEDDPAPCILDCGDDACVEWANLRDEAGRGYAYHVSECELLDAPPEED